MSSQKKSSVPVKTGSKEPQKSKKTTVAAISKDSIQKAAYLLSREQRTYDEWIWLAAEADLMAKKNKKPNDAEIRILAEELGKKRISLQDLHWMIAERRLISRITPSDKKN